MKSKPETYLGKDLKVGLAAEFEREISEADVREFGNQSGDLNPLHLDAEYARTTTYERRIVHGAYQIGLASALLGMHLPGRHALLSAINSRFPSPLYYPCRVKVRGEITSWHEGTNGGQLRVVVQDAASHLPTAEVRMTFALHGLKSPSKEPETRVADEGRVRKGSGGERKAVLVTGASGGLGEAILRALAEDYHVLGVVRGGELKESVRTLAHVESIRADLSADGFEDALARALGSRPLYGVIHAAWPGAPRGGLLDAQDDVLREQLEFGSSATIRLARFLFANVDPDGGRFAAISSTAGSLKPNPSLAAYSLGKANLEHTVRLLAPELARKRITINALCPSFLPVGINKQADERRIRMETASIPMARVCAPEDVAGMLRYQLSPEASFVSGQVMALSGAQL
jgi:NAD(P)-dependent dehydrogenase (short-subunit alcohol dehydrogenase family)/acyl dehydratase